LVTLLFLLLLGVFVLCRCLYGGASKMTQARQLQRNPQLIIATPGRLLDFVNSGEVNLSRVSCAALF
jgi:superfamily II DNA/RNA helicase